MTVTGDWASHLSFSDDHAVFEMCVVMDEDNLSPYL
jgi:hypothetical protein